MIMSSNNNFVNECADAMLSENVIAVDSLRFQEDVEKMMEKKFPKLAPIVRFDHDESDDVRLSVSLDETPIFQRDAYDKKHPLGIALREIAKKHKRKILPEGNDTINFTKAGVPQNENTHIDSQEDMTGDYAGKENEESRIELTCLDNNEAPERTPETKEQWAKAAEIGRKHGVSYRFEENQSTGFGDAYMYPSIAKLEVVLKDLDAAGVGFDNIDLDNGADKDLVVRLKKAYKYGVSVNVGQFP